MKAVVIEQACTALEMQVTQVKIPKVKPGWVLVKIKAFGLNFAELLTRAGHSPAVKFPRIIGIECVGEVADPSDSNLVSGQRVVSLTGGLGREYDGSYAEYALIPADRVYPVESDLDWADLAVIPEMTFTAYASLTGPLQLKKEDVLLIRGGTSSVGLTAIKLAKAMGSQVVATTRNPAKAEILLTAGADHVLIDNGIIQQKTLAIYPNGVNKVLELVGTKTLKDSLQTLASGGITCMTGLLAQEWTFKQFSPMDDIKTGTYLTSFDGARAWPEIVQKIFAFTKQHKISMKPSRIFTLDEIGEAHAFMESQQANGKVVVVNP